MSIRRDGAYWWPAAAKSLLPQLGDIAAAIPQDRAGVRLTGVRPLQSMLAQDGRIGAIMASLIGPASRPVRAILFDKTAAANWSLTWHQDRTICVRARHDTDGFGPWTVKAGLTHVAPPMAVLAGMITVRIHLDPVPETNAPLLVAPGSHALGRIAVDQIPAIVQRHGTAMCLADAGDVWLYATPILHASRAASDPARRRVLQVDFAACDLPGSLEWLGV